MRPVIVIKNKSNKTNKDLEGCVVQGSAGCAAVILFIPMFIMALWQTPVNTSPLVNVGIAFTTASAGTAGTMGGSYIAGRLSKSIRKLGRLQDNLLASLLGFAFVASSTIGGGYVAYKSTENYLTKAVMPTPK